MKPFTVTEMTSKVIRGHRQCHPLYRLDCLSETAKVGYTYFQTKIAEITSKINQGHCRQHNLIGHMSLSLSAP